MSDPDAGGGVTPTTGSGGSLDNRLKALGDELKARGAGAVAEETGGEVGASTRRGMSLAMRLAAEFVAGILVGGAIGWGLDAWLGTSPWGLVVFLLAGFAAGVLNALRVAGVVAEAPGRRDREGRD